MNTICKNIIVRLFIKKELVGAGRLVLRSFRKKLGFLRWLRMVFMFFKPTKL